MGEVFGMNSTYSKQGLHDCSPCYSSLNSIISTVSRGMFLMNALFLDQDVKRKMPHEKKLLVF